MELEQVNYKFGNGSDYDLYGCKFIKCDTPFERATVEIVVEIAIEMSNELESPDDTATYLKAIELLSFDENTGTNFDMVMIVANLLDLEIHAVQGNDHYVKLFFDDIQDSNEELLKKIYRKYAVELMAYFDDKDAFLARYTKRYLRKYI